MNHKTSASLPRIRIAPIHNRPVVPEENPRFETLDPKPVARRDLPKDFQESVQMGWNDYLIYNMMFDYDFATAIRPFSACMWFNEPEDGEVPGWRDVARKYAEKGLILESIWGIRHGMPFRSGSGEMTVPEEVHQFLLETFGPRFWGWENGEQDQEYCAHYVFGSYGWTPQPSERSRKEAYEDFVRFSKGTLDRMFHDYSVSIGAQGFCHYYGEMGLRMIGLELSTGLPSSILRCAFLRGASKQYDLLTHNQISIFLRSPEQKPFFSSSRVFPSEGRGLRVEWQYAHPDGGTPSHLFKRLWFSSYMYGVSALGTEGGLFYDDVASLPRHYQGIEAVGVRPPSEATNDKDFYHPTDASGDASRKSLNRPAELEHNLTPLGRDFREWVFTTRAHPDRGVMYAPVALVMDFHHGWCPPVHVGMGQSRPEHVWGNIPYQLGDYHIDQFFHWIFPGYLEFAYAINGRGCLTPTPFGDSFDVLLTNASLDVFNKYQAAVLLGEMPDEPDFAATLEAFVRSGRTVVLCTRQMTGGLADLAGLEIKDRDLESSTSTSLVTGKSYRETAYLYDLVEAKDADVLAVNDAGHPLVCVTRVGEGLIFVITPVYWATGRRPDHKLEFIEGLPWGKHFMNEYFRGRQAAPVHFLEVVQEVIGQVFESYSLIELTGRPLQYIVNVTNEADKLLVTLINNGEAQWDGRLSVKGQRIKRCVEWLSRCETCIEDGALLAAVPATDVRIYELTCEESFLTLAPPAGTLAPAP